jgi:2-polyprenyl-3-methyl-5-hydroxy-6-metoxy-1,4-benzoquinol methylase
MNVRVDPENNETRALFYATTLASREILEVGCGDGRLTWKYASGAARVVAIDPFQESILRARRSVPEELNSVVGFQSIAFEQFAASCSGAAFDTVILAWSLC